MNCPLCLIETISEGRLALGYDICLTCGELEAQVESEHKSRRVAIAYDKGGYQYITEETDLGDLG
jgi:hypothetical protein